MKKYFFWQLNNNVIIHLVILDCQFSVIDIRNFVCFSHLINYLQDEYPEVRQAAAYGVGVMATCAKDVYSAAIRGKFEKCLKFKLKHYFVR